MTGSDPGASPTEASALQVALDAVLHSYSAVMFAQSRRIGLLLLLATFVVPSVGLVGLVGVCLANAISVALQLDRRSVRAGLLGYNALLVFLAIGALLDRSALFYVVAAVAALLTVLVHVALAGVLRVHLRLPALSLPFVFVTWVLVAAVPHLKGVALVAHPPAVHLPSLPGPGLLDAFLRSLGAIFFQPHWVAGLLVLGALWLWSRIAVVHAVLGFAVAWMADAWLLHFPSDFFHVYAGFNIVLTAVALGGVFYVPGPGSLLLAMGGALTSALLTVAGLAVLAPHGLPVLALPLNMVLLITMYALRQRPATSRPRAVVGMGESPEANLAWYRQRVARFAVEGPVRLALPFRGAWTVSQGNDGPHTHHSVWRHGLDFEVTGADGRWFEGQGTELADHHCYRLPVTAPCAATVVRVVDGLPDNPPGTWDRKHPWGNLLVLQVAPARYFVLAHLAAGSIRVRPGASVMVGQELARCGASGRAPRPHLHVQLRSSPEIGAPTVPLAFHDVWTSAGDGPRIARALVPQEGASVRNLAPGTRPVGWTVGTRQRWMLERGEGKNEPIELEARMDGMGGRRLDVRGTDSCLRFERWPSAFFALGVEGRHPAVRVLYAALLKVPLDGALDKVGATVTWTDTIDLRVVVPRPVGWIQDILSVFVPVKPHVLACTARRDGEDLVVEGRSSVLRTEAHIGPAGLTRAVLEVRGRRRSLTVCGDEE